MNKLLISLLTGLTILVVACDTTESDKLDKTITLTKIDVGVNEAYINVRNDNPATDKTVSVFREGKEILSFNGGITDTSIADTNLMRSTNYSYSARLSGQGETIGKSNKLNITTLEPTSHEFVWKEFVIGSTSSSSIKDVTIIDGKEVWAVGEIFTNIDNRNDKYNVIVINQDSVQLRRIDSKQYGGIIGYSKINTILGFESKNIWAITNSGSYIHINDTSWTSEFISERKGGGLKMWGLSSMSIYLCGRNGSLSHYNGSNWKLIELSTNQNITDIWGFINPINGLEEVLCVVPNEERIIKVTNKLIEDEIIWKNNRIPRTIWTPKGLPIYTGGDGLYFVRTKNWKKVSITGGVFITGIRGSSLNDIFAVGIGGFVTHFNGESWNVYEELLLDGKVFESVYIKDDLVAIAGMENNNAILIIGKRRR